MLMKIKQRTFLPALDLSDSSTLSIVSVRGPLVYQSTEQNIDSKRREVPRFERHQGIYEPGVLLAH